MTTYDATLIRPVSYDEDDAVPRADDYALASGATLSARAAAIAQGLALPNTAAIAQPLTDVLGQEPSRSERSSIEAASKAQVRKAQAAATVASSVRAIGDEMSAMVVGMASCASRIQEIQLEMDARARLHEVRVLQAHRAISAKIAEDRAREEVAPPRLTPPEPPTPPEVAPPPPPAAPPVVSAPPAEPPPAPAWDGRDAASVRARQVTTLGCRSTNAPRITDPNVAFAAICYLERLAEGATPDDARLAAFRDVAEVLAGRCLSARDLPRLNQILTTTRESFLASRDSESAFSSFADSVRGDR